MRLKQLLMATALLFLAPALLHAQSFAKPQAQFLPWAEWALSSKTDPQIESKVFGGTFRFDTALFFNEQTRPDAYRLRLDLSILRGAGAAALNPGDTATWGKYADLGLVLMTKPTKKMSGNISLYTRYAFRTSVDGDQILERFDRDYEVGGVISSAKDYELFIGAGRFARLPNRFGWAIRGRAPVPWTESIIWLDGEAILGIGPNSGGGDTFLLHVGVDPIELFKTIAK